MELPTDSLNLAEICAYHVRSSRDYFARLVAQGHAAPHARAQALAYLRRKTTWTEPLAAGAFDAPDGEHHAKPKG